MHRFQSIYFTSQKKHHLLLLLHSLPDLSVRGGHTFAEFPIHTGNVAWAPTDCFSLFFILAIEFTTMGFSRGNFFFLRLIVSSETESTSRKLTIWLGIRLLAYPLVPISLHFPLAATCSFHTQLLHFYSNSFKWKTSHINNIYQSRGLNLLLIFFTSLPYSDIS